MRKIYITINNDITDEQALELVLEVIKQGRISNNNKCYCYCTKIGNNLILADKKKNDTFRIEKSFYKNDETKFFKN